MHILVCNERFLFRFGVDRVLILLGQDFSRRGYKVSLMANHCDEKIVESFAHRLILSPTRADSYLNLNEYTADWLEKNWNDYFKDDVPDIVLLGGWPFFCCVPFFKKLDIKVVFMDCGAVPIEGFSDGALVVQEKLRALRKKYLKDASLITSISNFIADTQSRSDTDGNVSVHPILLGADHMESSIWQADKLTSASSEKTSGSLLDRMKSEGRKVLLNLGRWEPGCYKNSEASFDVLRKIKNAYPDCALFCLAEASSMQVPKDLQENVFPIGFPDDHELVEIMRRVDVGISVSLWEGFNLPIVEMQWLERPVLAFNLAAHPEVILHPWYLCSDTGEMAHKLIQILQGKEGLGAGEKYNALVKFRDYFRWKRVFSQYQQAFEEMVSEGHERKPLSILIDVTNATKDPANSGVIRVTRRLCRALQQYTSPIFVVWDTKRNTYVFPTQREYDQLGQYNGPLLFSNRYISHSIEERGSFSDTVSRLGCTDDIWLVLSETVQEQHGAYIRQLAKQKNIKVSAIFYDAIPVMYPEFCSKPVAENHIKYMRGLAECDVVIPISNFSGQCLEKYWMENKINGCPIVANLLPGEFGNAPRVENIAEEQHTDIKILCVSTLEPRKNHQRLLDACLLMQEKHPELNWSLTLVGNKYAGAFEIADKVQEISNKHPRIKWMGIVDDATLHNLYKECTFTVYPSIVEGFGMPILESIWHAKPCVCSNEGVMSELAEDGGCLTANIKDAYPLYEALYRLSTDKKLWLDLSSQAIARKIKTWGEYAKDFLHILNTYSGEPMNIEKAAAPSKEEINDNTHWVDWEEILYGGCLRVDWQMNESERLGLMALLHRHKPRCSIEIGTYKGGSLSLISQYSEMVFSIDIDPSIPGKFSYFKNVSFFTGPSSIILPGLLRELDEQNIPVDFVLIDGDHSAKGVKRDIEIMLSYVPKKPLFIVLHDGFNPECRKGMLEADWQRSPYVQWVDIDFIPGRMIEHGGGGNGEMWGGLAMAYLHPNKRPGKFDLKATSKETFSKMKALQYGA